MRRLAAIAAVMVGGAAIRRALGRLLSGSLARVASTRDEANIQRLARREGCTLDEARRLYELARIEGYGAAHRAVFGPPDSESSPERPAR